MKLFIFISMKIATEWAFFLNALEISLFERGFCLKLPQKPFALPLILFENSKNRFLLSVGVNQPQFLLGRVKFCRVEFGVVTF